KTFAATSCSDPNLEVEARLRTLPVLTKLAFRRTGTAALLRSFERNVACRDLAVENFAGSLVSILDHLHGALAADPEGQGSDIGLATADGDMSFLLRVIAPEIPGGCHFNLLKDVLRRG